jgi:hypothetical protein
MVVRMSSENLSSKQYNTPKVYSDEATLLDLYAKLVRTHDWKDDYLVPSGASWPNIRVWNGTDYDIGYVNKGDARVNLIAQSSAPPFEFVIGYNVGQDFAEMDSDYRIKQKIKNAYERTIGTLDKISESFDSEEITVYRALVQSVSSFEDPQQRARRLKQSISDSLEQPKRSFGYITYQDDSNVGREIVLHNDFPSDEGEKLRRLLTDE